MIESFSELLLPLSVSLQSKVLDIFAALALADNCQSVLRERREDAHTVFRVFFEEIQEISLTQHPAPDELPGTATEALNQCSPLEYPKISTLLQTFATLPVTTSSAERSFSILRLVKTYLRSTMRNDRLNGLASMYIERGIPVSPEEVLDDLALNPRKFGIAL